MTTTLLRHARLIDGSGGAPIDADVLVDGERIARVGPTGSLDGAAAAETIDLAGATLMPGLIEPHAHLSFVDQTTPHAFNTIPVEEHLLLTLKHAKLYLDCGFTSCFSRRRDQATARHRRAQRDRPRRASRPAPLAASVQFTVTGGVGDLRQMHLDPGEAMYTLPCDGPVEFRRAAREACREGVDVLKIVPSGDTSTPAVPSARTLMTDDEVAAVCEVARAQRARRRRARAQRRVGEDVRAPRRRRRSTTRPTPTTRRRTCSSRRRTACSSRRRCR